MEEGIQRLRGKHWLPVPDWSSMYVGRRRVGCEPRAWGRLEGQSEGLGVGP